MEEQVRTFEVRRLTKEETELATGITRELARINLLRLHNVTWCIVGAATGFLVSAILALFADDLAAAFNIPFPLSPSGTRVTIGVGTTLLLLIIGGIVGRLVGPPLFVEPRRRHALGRLKELIRDRRLPSVLQKIRRIQSAHSELWEIAREGGGALPLSPAELPVEVREFYPRI